MLATSSLETREEAAQKRLISKLTLRISVGKKIGKL